MADFTCLLCLSLAACSQIEANLAIVDSDPLEGPTYSPDIRQGVDVQGMAYPSSNGCIRLFSRAAV